MNSTLKKGRKTGSTDSVNITIEQLLQYVKPSTVIPVRRKWLAMIEELNGVSFVEKAKVEVVGLEEEPLVDEEIVSAPPVEELCASAADAVVRPRIIIEEEEI